jgi:hypothetical protein
MLARIDAGTEQMLVRQADHKRRRDEMTAREALGASVQ